MATDPLDALRAECELFSELVLGLPEEDFARPTRLPAWNVKELVAHLYRTINRINTGLDQTAPPEPDYDSVTYWRSYDPAVDSSNILDRAKELASSFGSVQELASAWDEMWPRARPGRAPSDPGPRGDGSPDGPERRGRPAAGSHGRRGRDHDRDLGGTA